jgi:hypothetical protein
MISQYVFSFSISCRASEAADFIIKTERFLEKQERISFFKG